MTEDLNMPVIKTKNSRKLIICSIAAWLTVAALATWIVGSATGYIPTVCVKAQTNNPRWDYACIIGVKF